MPGVSQCNYVENRDLPITIKDIAAHGNQRRKTKVFSSIEDECNVCIDLERNVIAVNKESSRIKSITLSSRRNLKTINKKRCFSDHRTYLYSYAIKLSDKWNF